MLSITGRVILRSINKKFARQYLSNAYKCQEVWEQRKKPTIFQKIDYDDLFHQLDRNFQIGNRISMLDVDLFANGISGEGYQNELEEILFKARLNPETGLMGERTMHAVIKYYLSINKKNDLLTILSNRLGYGIFPDYFISNILMDDFLKDNDSIGATKIAVLQMLQEDFNHVILQKMSLLSCLKYLNSSDIWALPKEQVVQEDDDEIERVRVSYIKNPYFDDHFDLVDTNHLVGKTLYLAGCAGSGVLDVSCQIIGLALHEKFEKLQQLLQKINSSKNPISRDALTKAEEYVKKKPKQLEDVAPTEDASVNAIKDTILKTIEILKMSTETEQSDLESLATDEVTKAVEKGESKDIQQLTKLYRLWESERENHIQFEIRESNKRKTASEIEKTKEELRKQEEVIFFFDKEDEWKFKVTEKEEEMEALAKEQSKYKKKHRVEEYIPPEVGRKRD